MIKTLAISTIVSLVVSFVVVGLVGGNQPAESLGAITRMPNVDLVAKSITASTTVSTATSTIAIMGNSGTQGGQVIVKDTDALGCTSIAALNGTVISATVACP